MKFPINMAWFQRNVKGCIYLIIKFLYKFCMMGDDDTRLASFWSYTNITVHDKGACDNKANQSKLKLQKSCLFTIVLSLYKSFWYFAQTTAAWLPCSEQNFIMICKQIKQCVQTKFSEIWERKTFALVARPLWRWKAFDSLNIFIIKQRKKCFTKMLSSYSLRV